MIDVLFNQPNYMGAKKMLDATVLRHQAIATNIANVEKPHYQRVDLAPNFQKELSKAISSKDASQIASLQPALAVDATAVASNRDGNTVHLEDEMLKMTQNTLQHTLETQLISSSLAKLRLAIAGKGA